MKLKAIFFIAMISFVASIFAQEIHKKEGVFLDEKEHQYSGIYVSYYSNQLKESVYTIKNGKENGSAEFYYNTSEIMEQGYFKDGKKDGKWVRWSPAGNKLAEANYKDGVKEGEWLIWDERGIKRYEMYYEKGVKRGTWIMWDDKGQISNKKEY